MNLLVNAADAIDVQGDITLTCELMGSNIKIEVKDSGCGIENGHLSKIFDPFFTTKEPGKGTGLGLSISHSIIQKYSGELRVDSQPGQGSCFTVVLPVPSVLINNDMGESDER